MVWLIIEQHDVTKGKSCKSRMSWPLTEAETERAVAVDSRGQQPFAEFALRVRKKVRRPVEKTQS